MLYNMNLGTKVEVKEMGGGEERADMAHDFYLYRRKDGRLVWKCLYCGEEVESFEEMAERQDEPCVR